MYSGARLGGCALADLLTRCCRRPPLTPKPLTRCLRACARACVLACLLHRTSRNSLLRNTRTDATRSLRRRDELVTLPGFQAPIHKVTQLTWTTATVITMGVHMCVAARTLRWKLRACQGCTRLLAVKAFRFLLRPFVAVPSLSPLLRWWPKLCNAQPQGHSHYFSSQCSA